MSVKELNVLITGASGLLGRTIYRYFKDDAYQRKYPINAALNEKFAWKVLGLCNSRVRGDLQKLDISDYAQVEKLIEEFKVIHFTNECQINLTYMLIIFIVKSRILFCIVRP